MTRKKQAMSRAEQYVQEGQAHHRAGRLRDAATAYQRALSDQKDYGPALHYLGLTLVQQGMVDLGRGMMEKALHTGGDGPALRNDLGLLDERAGRWQAAAVHYRHACEAQPAELACWQSLVRVLQRAGAQDEARQTLLTLIAQHPDHIPALEALARDAYDRGDRRAVGYAQRARALDPTVAQRMVIGFVDPATHPGVDAGMPAVQLATGADSKLVDEIIAGSGLRIFDDFLDDPDAVRAWAAGLDYTRGGGNYPGAQTGPLACEDMMQRLADRLGRAIKWISPDNGVVRITLASDEARTDIHVDDEQAVDNAHFAAVLYLTRPAHCAGGTSFWRHATTGWVKRPADDEIRAAGFADFKTFLRRETPQAAPQAFEALTRQRSNWTPLFTLPMRYNRLVLYRGNYFHAVDSLFGQGFDDGRLVRLFTFEFC